MLVTAIDRERFNETTLCLGWVAPVIVGIAEMADSVREFQRIVTAAGAGGGEPAFEYVRPIADAGHCDPPFITGSHSLGGGRLTIAAQPRRAASFRRRLQRDAACPRITRRMRSR